MPAQIPMCPKGWGKNVVFDEKGNCPISNAKNCIDCKVGAISEYWESKWKRLKQGKTS